MATRSRFSERAGREVRGRLYGIDAPETRQAFGQRAKQYASDIAFRREVTLQAVDRHPYGRVVGWGKLRDGRSLNKEMVRAGLAWWYLPVLRTASAQTSGVAQNQGIAALFAESGHVRADFDDDPSRFSTL